MKEKDIFDLLFFLNKTTVVRQLAEEDVSVMAGTMAYVGDIITGAWHVRPLS